MYNIEILFFLFFFSFTIVISDRFNPMATKEWREELPMVINHLIPSVLLFLFSHFFVQVKENAILIQKRRKNGNKLLKETKKLNKNNNKKLIISVQHPQSRVSCCSDLCTRIIPTKTGFYVFSVYYVTSFISNDQNYEEMREREKKTPSKLILQLFLYSKTF